ncbi:hypothetical protein ATO6_13955 [Oceanicola sp. 22II-s10i]|uniref:DUF2125 domain-containing protein n=1 Tax=Oceanicola sp. 22II-s10i TaxID=1317116 RepID=UPI000B762D66|nr:DUF2125 domain-containing protein [Oceanicola sp. 22II-s10i]OWU84158.1 hypothetical protein ATO6_13955 [Oceanicola sp. 22II-s10i]
MKKLLALVLILALGWSAYWVIGSRSAKGAFEGWFADRRAEGWQADYADLSVRGFPNRFDTTFTDLAIADPATGWAWEAPFFQLLALSYQPTRVIAVFPPESTVATPIERLAVTAGDLKASLSLSPAPRLPLERATFVGSDITVGGEAGASVGTLRLATELKAETEATYRYGVLTEGVTVPDVLLSRLAQGISLPPVLTRLELDMDTAFDRPWDLDALERARPQPQQIVLRKAEGVWGELQLAATGTLDIDALGQPEGEIAIKAERWREMLGVAVNAGVLPGGVADQVEKGLSFLANLTGRPDSLNVTLTFSGGRVYLGPVPLGPAPIIRLR